MPASVSDRYGGRPSSSSLKIENELISLRNKNVLGFQIDSLTTLHMVSPSCGHASSSSSYDSNGDPSSGRKRSTISTSSTITTTPTEKKNFLRKTQTKKINNLEIQQQIRPISRISPIKNSVASSLTLLQQSSSYQHQRLKNINSPLYTPPISLSSSGGQFSITETMQEQQQYQQQQQQFQTYGVPLWFPWIPTRMQVHSLKVSELREACAERGLIRRGNKAELQERLLQWTKEQHRQRIIDRRLGNGNSSSNNDNVATTTNSILNDLSSFGFGTKAEETSAGIREKERDNNNKVTKNMALRNQYTALSSEAHDDGIEPLINRRKALMRARDERLKGKNTAAANDRLLDSGSLLPNKRTDDDEEDDEYDADESMSLLESKSSNYLTALQKSFNSPPSQYSNFEVKEMYTAVKRADQDGTKRPLVKQLLTKLHDATPNDSRVLRRLARMEQEDGNISTARQILQHGLRRNPNDAHLLQGLGNIELSSGNDVAARRYFRSAIQANPEFPNPHHALGTLEHSRGRIRVATSILKKGLKSCPANHRLHHALGDLYRDAGLFDLAESSYRSGLAHGPNWSRPFAYTALSYLSYEKNRDLDACRNWLRRGLGINNGMHSQGWIALAHLEESEGLIVEAREVYIEAITRYEMILAKKRNLREGQGRQDEKHNTQMSQTSIRPPSNGAKPAIDPVRSGDKWMNVYKSWAQFEDKHGSYRTANDAFSRGTIAFPRDWSLPLQWARLQVKYGMKERARKLFAVACDRAGSSHADPYRLYAEFEMSQKNYSRARSILFLGAQSLSVSSDGGLGNRGDLARLYYTWAICEWHLGDIIRAEVLFDHSLRLTDAGENGSEIRSLILYAIARLEYARGEYLLAQHCVGLSLKENLMPGGNSQIWLLWADIAKAMDNDSLEKECLNQAEILSSQESKGATEDLSRLLGLRRKSTGNSGLSVPDSQDQVMTRSAVQKLLRKEPWHSKISNTPSGDDTWYERVVLPDISPIQETVEN